MQIKAGFIKEWLHFTRTFRLGGVILATVSFAIADPLMYWFLSMLLGAVSGTTGSVSFTGADILSGAADMFNSSAIMYCMTLSEFCGTSLLIIMLVLMSPSGGEQKKRATIIPSCSGLDMRCYLVPKYVIYPLTVFAATFLSCCIAGGICMALFDGGMALESGMMLLSALLCGIYAAFFITVYMSIGLFTSRPGLVTVFMYIGMSLVDVILTSLDLSDFQPLTLKSLVTGRMFGSDFVLADNIANIAVSVLLSFVIGAMMFFLTLAVLRGRKINNRVDKPEF